MNRDHFGGPWPVPVSQRFRRHDEVLSCAGSGPAEIIELFVMPGPPCVLNKGTGLDVF